VIQNPRDRSGQSLNGRWRAIVDPYETGYYQFGQPSRRGFFSNFKPRHPGDRVEYDFDQSDLLSVPGDWNSQDPRLFFYEGTVWYKRDFRCEPRPGHRYFLHFGAANYELLCWVNAQPVGEHTGGFTGFCFEVTEQVKAGDNFVVAKVDNRRLADGVPTLDTDWWNYGGITRDVGLIEVPDVFVRDYGLDLGECWVEVDGAAEGERVELSIGEWRAELTCDGTGRARCDLGFEPDLWSPERPTLYDVTISTRGDVVRDRVGFRSIETRGQEVWLNGASLFLRGISIHEEAPLREGRAWSEADARTLLGWAKELGCNFVRLAHYPHNEHMVRVADELGLLVWSEIPVYWSIDWTNAATLANARNQLAEMISRDRNRACVIVWSVGNETPSGDERLAFMSELIAHARELDGTRLVSAALLVMPSPGRELVIDDPLGEHTDLVACNEYLGWYYAEADEIPQWKWRIAFDKPVILSELGGGALAGLHGDREQIWTEEHQAHVYRRQVEMWERVPGLAGTTPWILQDFRSPKRVLPGIQDRYNRKGLISDRGERKLAFDVLRDYYARVAEAGGPVPAPVDDTE